MIHGFPRTTLSVVRHCSNSRSILSGGGRSLTFWRRSISSAPSVSCQHLRRSSSWSERNFGRCGLLVRTGASVLESEQVRKAYNANASWFGSKITEGRSLKNILVIFAN
jgi:hypothetical protein